MDTRLRFVRGLIAGVLGAFLATGCSALGQSEAPFDASPPLHHAPGGGYVPGDTSYHGSQGP